MKPSTPFSPGHLVPLAPSTPVVPRDVVAVVAYAVGVAAAGVIVAALPFIGAVIGGWQP